MVANNNFSDEKTFYFVFIWVRSIILIFFLKHTTSVSVFLSIENGNSFHAGHIQIKKTSGKMTVPIWGCLSAEGSEHFVR